MRARAIVSLVVSLVFSALFVPGAVAQVPPVPQGFPQQACTPGQLFFRQIGLGRVTTIAYHNGWMYSSNVAGGSPRTLRFGDVNDPASLLIQDDPNVAGYTVGHGTHGHTKTGDYVGADYNFGLRRVSPGVNDHVNGDMPSEEEFFIQQPPPADSGLHRMYYPWATPFNWLQYGPTPATARLYRANELLAEWEPLGDHGVAGNSILLGNLLFITSDASMRGVLAYDISPVFDTPAGQPRLLDKLTGPIGGYLGAIWENYLVIAGGADRDLLFIVDISDPTNLQLVDTLNLAGNAELDAGTNVPYVQTQDEFIFTRRHKINMETRQAVLELDEVGDNRPAGSVGGQLGTSQFMLPIGNLLVTGAYSSGGRDGVGVWCHDAQPDTRAPYVGYHVPRDGQTNFPLGAPISLVIAETLESYTIVNGETISLRPVGGSAVDAWVSFSHDGVLTVTPREYLQPNTSYELVISAGGIKDVAGNGIEAYSFSFSTGSSVSGGNAAPTVLGFVADRGAVSTGESVTYTATASDDDGDNLEYRFIFGDGSLATAWSSATQATHRYSEQGHYEVKLQVRDLKPDGSRSVVSATRVQTVAELPGNAQATHSSPIAQDIANDKIWVVNPDNDSVTRFDGDSATRELEIDLSAMVGGGRVHPSSLAIAAGGQVWVTARDADQVIVLNANGSLRQLIDAGYGSAPVGVAITRDGSTAFVTLRGRATGNPSHGQLLRFSTSSLAESGRMALGPEPHSIAVSGDGQRVFVSRFISAEHHGVIWEVSGSDMSLSREILLHRDRGVEGIDSGGSDGPGVPNYVRGLTLSPDEQWLFYTASKSDTNRGLFFQQDTEINGPLGHDSTVRAVVGRVDLLANAGQEPVNPYAAAFDRSRIDLDNAESPTGVVFSPRGNYFFLINQGNNALAAFDHFRVLDGFGRTSLWRTDVGAAPQGLVFDAERERIWVKNFLSRDVSIVDVSAFMASGEASLPSSTRSSVSSESLAPDVLAGKQHFYFAGNEPTGDNEMSMEGYISCATCHVDGGHDGMVWDFTQRGEGLRNTTDLRGRGGMQHGPVHWSGNFDEIQDFALDIVNEFDGRGFLNGQQPHSALGTPNAGRSLALDDLAAYVSSLGPEHLPNSPYRESDGRFSSQALAGREQFALFNCASCHVPDRAFTDSSLASDNLHDVGTVRTSSGSRLGGRLSGIDTPTLLGLWNTAPYFHDGSAQTLEQVFHIAGGEVLQLENGSLSGNANIPQYIQYNADSSSYGTYVNFRDVGDAVTLSAVNGGAGGAGVIEVRYLGDGASTREVDIRLLVNGSLVAQQNAPIQRELFGWQRLGFEQVPLRSGSNTVRIEMGQGDAWTSVAVDQITVSTADDLQRASAHRQAGALGASDFANLMRYLRSLDGRDENGELITNPPVEQPGMIFADRFQSN
jgi:DNA-binding beta-propeller fold protein YncE